MRNKPLAYKLRLIKAGKSTRSVPAWIIARTSGGIRYSPKSVRAWRNRKLKD